MLERIGLIVGHPKGSKMDKPEGLCYYCKKPVCIGNSIACADCDERDTTDRDNAMEAMYGQ